MEGEITVIAFDIEARGYSPKKHGIVSVGVCVGDTRGNVLCKLRWNVKSIAGQEFEPRCKTQFWDNHPSLLAVLSVSQISAEQFAKEFRAFLDERPRNVYLLSDNPAFDAKFIDYYLDLYGHRGMQYDSTDDKVYRSIHDSDSYTRGRMGFGFEQQWVDDAKLPGIVLPEITAHFPDDDAEKIYKVHVQVTAMKK